MKSQASIIPHSESRSSLVNWGSLVLLLLAIALGFVYRGFFYPDEVLLKREPASYYLLMTLRIGIPLIAVAILSLVLAARRGIVPSVGVHLFLGSIVLTLFLVASLGSIFALVFAKTPDLSEYNSVFQISPPRYIARDPTLGITPKKIFFLGGSTTEWQDSTGIDWPSRVERILNVNNPAAYEAHNLGKQWYTSLHSLINYQVNLQQYKPDVIVVMHAINDLTQNADFSYYSVGEFREDYGHFLGPLVNIVRYRNVLSSIGLRLRRLWNYSERETINTESFPGLVPFRRNLTTLVRAAQGQGTKVILMTQPHMLRPGLSSVESERMTMVHHEAVGPTKMWSLETATSGMRQYNETTRKLARELQVPLVDLEFVLPQTLEYFSDEVHYEDRSYPILADLIARSLRDSGV